MSDTEYSKPAFPTGDHPGSNMYVDPGMTLRDYFAAKALASIIMIDKVSPLRRITDTAYEYADAMIEARSK